MWMNVYELVYVRKLIWSCFLIKGIIKLEAIIKVLTIFYNFWPVVLMKMLLLFTSSWSRSKPVWLTFFSRTQGKIFWGMLVSKQYQSPRTYCKDKKPLRYFSKYLLFHPTEGKKSYSFEDSKNESKICIFFFHFWVEFPFKRFPYSSYTYLKVNVLQTNAKQTKTRDKQE